MLRGTTGGQDVGDHLQSTRSAREGGVWKRIGGDLTTGKEIDDVLMCGLWWLAGCCRVRCAYHVLLERAPQRRPVTP